MLSDCMVVSLNNEIKQQYVLLRKKYQLKLVDAIIAATAIALDIPLITSDKQFETVKELQLLHYEK